MPPQQDDIRIEHAEDANKNSVVVVNGKEVVVSSATEKPSRSLWVAWLYIFDVSRNALECCRKVALTRYKVVSESLLTRREEARTQARLHLAYPLLSLLLHQVA